MCPKKEKEKKTERQREVRKQGCNHAQAARATAPARAAPERFPIEQLCNCIIYDEMAAASYSSDVLQRFDEAIQSLPPEIREKIYKELVTIKMRERKEMGWNEVNDDIEDVPFCEKRLRITKVLFCFKCNNCQRNGLDRKSVV